MTAKKGGKYLSLLALVLASVFAPICAFSQTTIDVDTAVARALRSNLGVENERLNLANKKLARDTAWNRFVPALTAGAAMSHLNTTQQIAPALLPDPTSAVAPGVYDRVVSTPTIDLPQWGVGVRLSAQLTLSAQMFYGVRQTVLDYQSGVTSLDKARSELDTNVRKQFYNLLLLQQSIKLQQEAIKTAEQRLAQTEANYKNGLVDEFTYLSAQVSLANLKPALEELQSGYDTAVMAFNQTIGLGITERPTLQGTIKVEPLAINSRDSDILIARFLAGRYDLRGLDESIAGLNNLIRATKAGFYPTLTLGYTLDPTFTGDPFKDPWFADVKNDWKQMSGAFSISLGFRLDSLLPSSQTWTQIAQYRNQLKQTQNALVQAREGAEIEVRRVVATLSKTRNTLEVKKMNVALAQRALSLAETGYQAGTRDLLDVRSAEQDLQKAQVDELSDEYTYTVGLLDLKAALNTSIQEIRDTIHENQTGK